MASGSDNQGHLKLTLRTLLAWLDDALPPEEARNIGQKVSESPVARELIARIKKVSRSRRITIPAVSGPDATDPNLVAAYLDNALPPEQLTEYEERCLKSEIHLSEAASCHQILSMLGQKAKVPGEARFRMYRLIRGRDAVSQEPTAASQEVPPAEPAAAPIPRWSGTVAEEETGWQRYWPLAAIAGLLLCLAGTTVLLAPPRSAFRVASDAEAEAGAPAVVVRPPLVVPPQPEAVAAAPESETEPTAVKAEEVAAAPAPAADTDVAPAQAGNRFVVSEREGLLLRKDPDASEWKVLAPGTAVQAGDELLGLAPYRTALKLGDAEVELIGPTRLRLVETQAPGSAPALELEIGRIVIQGGTSLKPITVVLGEQKVQVTPPIGGPAGVARIDQRSPGSVTPGTSVLEFTSARDSVALATAAGVETRISGPSRVALLPDGTFEKPESSAPPVWLLAQRPSEVDSLLGADFAKFFPADARVNRSLAEALDSDQAEISDLAVTALGAMGQIDLILPALTRDDKDSAIRNRVITVLRSFGARDEASARSLRAQLDTYGDEAWGAIVEKLLIGFSAEAAAKPETYTELVRLLEHRDPGVRTLALEQLMQLSGRDRLEYDPARPTEGRGLEAWKQLLRAGDLKPAPGSTTAPKAPASPPADQTPAPTEEAPAPAVESAPTAPESP